MPEILQNILIILLAFYMAWDNGTGGQITNNWPVIIGLLIGLIMGDVETALVIGGTLQLMSLGVATIGGASVPEYGLATIVSVYFAVRTGVSTGTAIAVGLPVGMLTLQLDVIFKMLNSFYAHLSPKLLREKKYRQMEWVFYCSVFTYCLKYVIPITLVISFGTPVIESILKVVPDWFTDGLTIAGGMLPVVGIGMLMRYMPVKKYLTYLIAGFVFSAYLGLPVLGIALLGAGAAYAIYQSNSKALTQVATSAGETDLGDDFDE